MKLKHFNEIFKVWHIEVTCVNLHDVCNFVRRAATCMNIFVYAYITNPVDILVNRGEFKMRLNVPSVENGSIEVVHNFSDYVIWCFHCCCTRKLFMGQIISVKGSIIFHQITPSTPFSVLSWTHCCCEPVRHSSIVTVIVAVIARK